MLEHGLDNETRERITDAKLDAVEEKVKSHKMIVAVDEGRWRLQRLIFLSLVRPKEQSLVKSISMNIKTRSRIESLQSIFTFST